MTGRAGKGNGRSPRNRAVRSSSDADDSAAAHTTGRGQRKREQRPFDSKRAWDYLLFLLARRSYTVAQLREKLLRRSLPEDDAEQLLGRLAELGLVNDALFTEQYVYSRKGARGRLGLARELSQKGVSEELVERQLAELSPAHQADAATALLEKNAWRYKPGAERGADTGGSALTDEVAYQRREQLYKARSKAFAFLARRGFTAEAASVAVERVGWFGEE